MWHTLRLILHVFLVFQIYSLLDVSNWGSRFSTKYFIMFTCMQSPVSISTYYWCNGPFLYFFANGCTGPLFLGLLRQIITHHIVSCLCKLLLCITFLQIEVPERCVCKFFYRFHCFCKLLYWIHFFAIIPLINMIANCHIWWFVCKLLYNSGSR